MGEGSAGSRYKSIIEKLGFEVILLKGIRKKILLTLKIWIYQK